MKKPTWADDEVLYKNPKYSSERQEHDSEGTLVSGIKGVLAFVYML